ncbi:hypothetical protein V8D89_008340 [Ganoderma adspersum]
MLSKLLLVTALASAAFAASNCPSKRATGDLKNANFWFAFGDSYTARGFNTSRAVPAPGNPFGNPAYPGNTGVGANWIDFDTVEFNKSLILTYDYARAGATINGTLVKPTLTTYDFITQVNHFEAQVVKKKPASAPWTSKNAMFSVWFGINDINNSYNKGGDRNAFSDKLIDQYFAQVQRLYIHGARNFIFIGVPPIYRTPHMLAKSASARSLQKSVMDGYNYRLAVRVHSWAAKYPGVKAHIWDANVGFNNVLNDPKKYGFKNVTAVGDFWANDFHPSSKAHHIWAQDVATVLKGTVWL